MTSIIWDMGGTLVDTYPQVDEVLADTTWPQGPTASQRAEVARLRTVSIDHAVTELAARHGVDVEELRQAYARLKERWRERPAPLMPGARKVMEAVRAGGGLNLVATHRDRSSAESLLEGLGVDVDDLVCAPDGLARKPDPAMNRLLLERHHLDPVSVWCVGDRGIDVEAALAARCRAFLLDPDGEPAVREEAGMGAWTRITALADLLPRLEEASCAT